jgi:hypothetical protein
MVEVVAMKLLQSLMVISMLDLAVVVVVLVDILVQEAMVLLVK